MYNTHLKKLINKYLSKKIDFAKVSAYLDDSGLIKGIFQELELCIKLYNSIHIDSVSPIYLNIKHSKALTKVLPKYTGILNHFLKDETLQSKVMAELSESDYFQEVYEISDPLNLLINILILIYRTSMLCLDESLREGKIQISSTLEELSAIQYLEGKETKVFNATKNWIRNWELEGFHESLAKMIS